MYILGGEPCSNSILVSLFPFHFLRVLIIFYKSSLSLFTNTHTPSSHHTNINVRHCTLSFVYAYCHAKYTLPFQTQSLSSQQYRSSRGKAFFNQIVVRSFEVFGFESEKFRAIISLLKRLYQQKRFQLVCHFASNR